MMEWLFQDVPSDAGGWALLITFCITAIWGVTTLGAAIRDRNRLDRPFWRTFRFWLGVFLCYCDSVLYAILAIDVLRKPDPNKLWAVLLTVSWGVVTLIAFVVWAREEWESRQ